MAALAAAAPARAQDVAFETVLAGLKSPDPSARIGALVLLRQAGYLEAAPAIAPLLADPTRPCRVPRWRRCWPLSGRCEATPWSLRPVASSKQKGATLALFAFVQGPGATIANAAPPEIIRGLVLATGSITPAVRFDAAYSLAVLGRPLVLRGRFPDTNAVLDGLIAILRESSPVMKQAATNALGRLLGAANESGVARRRPRVHPRRGRRPDRRRLERGRPRISGWRRWGRWARCGTSAPCSR